MARVEVGAIFGVEARRVKKTKVKRPKPAKGCLCAPMPKPLYPVADHNARCPISKRYTVNGRIIADMMHTQKMRGNPKDYVILSGSSLLDFDGTYEVRREVGKALALVCIVHKRNLQNVIGPKESARFWKPGFGRVRNG